MIPIFKSGDSAQIGNYRPVSVLPFFQKYLNVLCMSDYSTDTALVFLIDKILKALDEGEKDSVFL